MGVASISPRDVERWLARNGFVLKPGGSHVCYEHIATGAKVAVSRRNFTDNVLVGILRSIERLGFDRKQVRAEMAGGR